MKRTFIRSIGVIAALGLAACNSGSSNNSQVVLHLRLFVANFATGGNTSNLSTYLYPVSNSSAPSTVLGSGGGLSGASGIAIDAFDDLFVPNASNNTVTGYVPFVTSGTVPTATISNGVSQPQDVTLDNAGNLYVANFNGVGVGPATGNVTVYGRPFSNTSVPSFAISNGISGPTSVTFDGVRSIYVTNKTAKTVTVYALPYTSGSPPTLTLSSGLTTPVATAVDPATGNVYVADQGGNSVEVFTGSLTNGSSPSFKITSGISAPRYLIFDPAGQLNVSNGNNTITIYPPPFPSSSPSVTISTGLSMPVGLSPGY